MQAYNPVTVSSAASSSAIIPYNSDNTPVGQLGPQPIQALGMICTVSDGASLTYSVQVSCDPPNRLTNWLNHDTLHSLNASQYGYVSWPVTAVRLTVSAWSSGSVTLSVTQWP